MAASSPVRGDARSRSAGQGAVAAVKGSERRPLRAARGGNVHERRADAASQVVSVLTRQPTPVASQSLWPSPMRGPGQSSECQSAQAPRRRPLRRRLHPSRGREGGNPLNALTTYSGPACRRELRTDGRSGSTGDPAGSLGCPSRRRAGTSDRMSRAELAEGVAGDRRARDPPVVGPGPSVAACRPLVGEDHLDGAGAFVGAGRVDREHNGVGLDCCAARALRDSCQASHGFVR